MRLLIGSLAVVLLAGCASQPSTSSGAASASAPAAAPVASSIAPAASPAASGSTATSAATTAKTKSYPGYKAKQKNGQTFYCKKVAKIGSRFEEETCMTEAEMESLASKAEEDRQQFRRNQTLCGTGGCGGG